MAITIVNRGVVKFQNITTVFFITNNIRDYINNTPTGSTMSENVMARTNWKGGNAAATKQPRAIKRHETPEDLVGACVFLSSAESDFVTGQTLVVDGGSAMW